MFVRDFARSVWRRWYVALAGILATAALCLAALAIVPTSYETKANVVFLPPSTSVVPGGNPYLQLGGLNQVVDVVARSLSSQQTAEEIKRFDPKTEFEVVRDLNTSGPILAITVDNPSSDGAIASVQALLDKVPSTLRDLQESLSITEASQITSQVLTRDDVPEPVTRSRLRAVIAAAGLGLLTTAMFIALIDGWIMRRRKSHGKPDGHFGSLAAIPADRDSRPVNPARPANRRNREITASNSPQAYGLPSARSSDESPRQLRTRAALPRTVPAPDPESARPAATPGTTTADIEQEGAANPDSIGRARRPLLNSDIQRDQPAG